MKDTSTVTWRASHQWMVATPGEWVSGYSTCNPSIQRLATCVLCPLLLLPRARMRARGRVIGLSVRIFVCLFIYLFVCPWHKSEEFERKRQGHELYLQLVDQKWKYLTFYVPHVRERPLKSSEKLCF